MPVLFTKGAPINHGMLPMGKFPLPELGKDTHALVRGMTSLEGRALKAAAKDAADLDDNDKRALEKLGLKPEDPLSDFRFLSWVIVNEDGTPVFTDGPDGQTAEDDVRENFHVAQASIQGILSKAMELSGLDVDRSKN